MNKLIGVLFLLVMRQSLAIPPLRSRFPRIDRSRLITRARSTTPQPSPRPFSFSYSAGRHAGGKPDRFVEQKGDEDGVIRGSYSYLDPNWHWQKVEYVADPETGFHVLGDDVQYPQESPEVTKARMKHQALFEAILNRRIIPVPNDPSVVTGATPSPPSDTKAVEKKKQEHADLYAKIAAEHARIAEELEALAKERLAEGGGDQHGGAV